MRRAIASVLLLVVAIASAATPSTPAAAKDNKCLEVPPALTARIEAGMKYYDVWLQAPRAVETPDFGLDYWFVSADVAGPQYESNADIATWIVSSLDASVAEIYRVEKGHADYLSDLPTAKSAGIDVGYLTTGLGGAVSCAQDAAKDTGALGIERKTWEERHGKTKDRKGGFKTKDGALSFGLTEDRVRSVTWKLADPVDWGVARVLSHDLIPDDAVRAGASAEGPAAGPDQPELYQSKWLAKRFESAKVWGGSDKGRFFVSFELNEAGLVSRIIIKLGEP